MVKKILRKSAFLGVLIFVLSAVISCEEDFTDIKSGVVSNTKFITKDTILDIVVSNAPVDNVRADGLTLTATPFFGFQGQYLLGTYINDDFENIEASIISQVLINTSLEVSPYSNPDNLAFETTIDTAYLRLPYYATLESNTDRPVYTLDSIVGNKDLPFTLNIYELDTYLNRLNPADPSKTNVFLSDTDYDVKPNPLNEFADIDFTPTANDTLVIIKRRNSLGDLFETDTIKYTSGVTSEISRPMAIIPLKKSFAKQVFVDNYGSSNFESQQAFNDYFRGIKIEAKEINHASGEKGGALISFNLRNSNTQASTSSIEVYYTNTYFKANSTEIDTVIKVNHTFQLGGIANNKFEMTNRTYPITNEVRLQGAAGSEAKVEVLNGNELADLKAKNWLINDASLTFYINKDIDTTDVPNKLFLYKKGIDANGNSIQSFVKDVYTETAFFGGNLIRESGKVDRYNFRITDYVSDLLSGETTYNPPLRLKVFNTSDTQINDTIFRNFSWNPKAVSLLNGDKAANGETRRAKLKISYTEKPSN
ncbi:MAG: DUF4270 family protein [Polaribacter sp.]|uniref:DUF4270 family protein n=1 Tax=Polaribacter sp. TaxID=1920175 RepID=UPI002602C7DB|nr:DUF4270 family protein [uncultured Polaribacter sp.]